MLVVTSMDEGARENFPKTLTLISEFAYFRRSLVIVENDDIKDVHIYLCVCLSVFILAEKTKKIITIYFST